MKIIPFFAKAKFTVAYFITIWKSIVKYYLALY